MAGVWRGWVRQHSGILKHIEKGCAYGKIGKNKRGDTRHEYVACRVFCEAFLFSFNLFYTYTGQEEKRKDMGSNSDRV